jgi:ABC-type spermidine/putrescine transport system permease subunit II
MTVFNRRNAVVGFATMKAASHMLERRRRRRSAARNRLKVALFVTLAVVSVGILAGVAAAFLKAKKSGPQHLEGYAAAEESAEVAEGEEVGEAASSADTAIAEPIPAT